MGRSLKTPVGTRLLELCVVAVAAGLTACGSSDPATVSTGGGGNLGAGGTVSGGGKVAAMGGTPASSGGALTGGTIASTGGALTGGAPASSGGSSTGGTIASTGGASIGGAPASSGGASIGGTIASTGGASIGGAPASSGGASTGGTSTTMGGAATGGTRASTGGTPASTGGTATGGTAIGGAATGGTAIGGASTGGTSATTGGTTGACTVGPPLSGGTDRCANGLGSLGNGYNYEIWMDSGTNCGTMYGVGAAFRAQWALGTGGDFLARAGLYFGATQTHEQIGTISADYAFTKLANNGFSWVAIYGWTFSNLAEYYIIEDWSVARPGVTYEARGSITVDGGTYDIFYNRRVGAVSPQGTNTDFDQFWSVRRQPRQCGHVSISEHFKQWQSLGMNMGGLLRESMIVVEALRASGTVDFASATVQVN